MGQDEHAATWSAVDKLDEIRKLIGIGVQGCVVSAVRHIIESSKSEIAKRDERIRDLEIETRDLRTGWDRSHLAEEERDKLTILLARAERALLRAGFVDGGGQEWKPPVNERVGELHQKCFALEAEVERLTKLAENTFDKFTTADFQVERLRLFESSYETIKAEYAKLKSVCEGQDKLIAELQMQSDKYASLEYKYKTLGESHRKIQADKSAAFDERDYAERAALYFAKRLAYVYHGGES